MGSVKDLRLIEPAYENRGGIGRFYFSDRYSVRDWGEMPDYIKNKGCGLAVMAASNFEGLEGIGIPTHYGGLIKVGGQLIRFSDLTVGGGSSNIMHVSMAVRYDPIARKFMGEDDQPRILYDYSFYRANRGEINNFLIPLEIIVRNGLPKGSSVFKALKKAKDDPAKTRKILDKLGLKELPHEGQMLPKPVMFYTTKLESGDRELDENEAYQISGLSEKEFRKIAPLTLRVNDYVSERAERTGLAPHWDFKVEMKFFSGRLELVDVVGTLDEDRFGDRISKEFLRQWYDDNQPEFAIACEEWKKTGEGWQKRCPTKPIVLPPELSKLVSQMYQSACNQYVEKEIFSNVPRLDVVMDRLKSFRD
jgi:phosphoribosylaminoimidazole-succinocarboxamide synthase